MFDYFGLSVIRPEAPTAGLRCQRLPLPVVIAWVPPQGVKGDVHSLVPEALNSCHEILILVINRQRTGRVDAVRDEQLPDMC